MKFKRVFVIVLDGVGVGASPDAHLYGDEDSNSVGNTSKAVGGLQLPTLQQLGLGHITDVLGVPAIQKPMGAYGKMQEKSAGKDTITGHWEMMGLYLEKPMPTYPEGFPRKLVDEFVARIGRDVLGNKPASGTEIINELGAEHVRTGKLIVYTSADSVFQIAAHEDIIPVEKLYEYCLVAREILVGEHQVGRVIARPFEGDQGAFVRTKNRRDYPLPLPGVTVMEYLVQHDYDVISIGKIDQIFNYQGITESDHTLSNAESIQALKRYVVQDFKGLLFANLIEFDMIYGHRNDPRGYADALEYFDRELAEIIPCLLPGDVITIVGDHGVDPTTPSTDHSREYVPLLIYGPGVKSVDLGIRSTFADLGAFIAENFDVPTPEIGTSFLREIV